MALSLHHCPLQLTVQWNRGNGQDARQNTHKHPILHIKAAGEFERCQTENSCALLMELQHLLTQYISLMFWFIQTLLSTWILHELLPFWRASFRCTCITSTACASFFLISSPYWISAICSRVPKWESCSERGYWLWKPAVKTWLFDFSLEGFRKVKLNSRWVNEIFKL